MKIQELLQENEVLDLIRKLDTSKEEEPVHLPGGFTVAIFNDDYTPFEVVIEAILASTNLSEGEAKRRMERAHQGGWSPIAAYASRDMAETVADNIMRHARRNTNYDHYRQHPHFRNFRGPWPLHAEVMEAGDGD